MSTESNTNIMDLKIFLDTILLLKRLLFEGILNYIKINGMVINHFNSALKSMANDEKIFKAATTHAVWR